MLAKGQREKNVGGGGEREREREGEEEFTLLRRRLHLVSTCCMH